MTEKVTKERCAGKVWDAQTWSSRRCQRAAGYGKDAAYCKVHAMRYPSMDDVAAGVVKYWAEWEFSMPGLARVMVIGETDRTFAITRKDDLIGYTYSISVNGTCKKGRGLLTGSMKTACEWIENKAALRVLAASNALDRARGRPLTS